MRTSTVHTRGLIVLLLGCTALRASATQTPGQQPAQAPCIVSQDAAYGHSPAQPVQVGGSPMYGAARQRRYLDALRGPEGQAIQYKRLGQARGSDETILDAYEIRYEGLEKPITLYLDWYHYDPPKAPKGFTCAIPFGLGIPPASPFQESEDLLSVAVEQAAARDEVAPIPLGADGSSRHGVIYDQFRMIMLAARAAAANGQKIDPEKPSKEIAQLRTVVVAYPLTCGERIVRPKVIDVLAPNGAVMPKQGQLEATGSDLARLLHGVQAPDGSLGLTAPMSAPRGGLTVRITYAEEACGSGGNEVSLELVATPMRPLDMPRPALPPGAPADRPVLLQALIDLDGRLQRPSYVGGPKELVAAASEGIRAWRADPARLNGAPVAGATIAQVQFAPK